MKRVPGNTAQNRGLCHAGAFSGVQRKVPCKSGKATLLFLLILSLLTISLSGCGGKRSGEVDLEELSGELLSSGAFTDILSEVDPSFATGLYAVEAGDILNCGLYCGTGATPEEIAVFKAADEAAALRLIAAAENRIDFQLGLYKSYDPEELPKLENALLVQDGVYVFCIVSNDTETVRDILSKY